LTHVKKYFLFYHGAYIGLIACVVGLVIYFNERYNTAKLAPHMSFLDAMFLAVSGVSCTGLLPLTTRYLRTASLVAWHVGVVLGSTVVTSAAPSILRIETLQLLLRLDAAHGRTTAPVRATHISKLLITSRIMFCVTVMYFITFVIIGTVGLGSSVGLRLGLYHTLSSFANAGFVSDPPPEFGYSALNLLTLCVLVGAGSTLFPVLLRPFTMLCAKAFEGFVRLMNAWRPNRDILGDPVDWRTQVFYKRDDGASATAVSITGESSPLLVGQRVDMEPYGAASQCGVGLVAPRNKPRREILKTLVSSSRKPSPPTLAISVWRATRSSAVSARS
jgi:hypothetical protein